MVNTVGLGETLVVAGAALLVCGAPLLALGLAVVMGLRKRPPL